MANNRLYLVDTATGEHIMLAKSLADGWYTQEGIEQRLDAFFHRTDPATGLKLDWGGGAGQRPTTLILMDEFNFDPDGVAAEKRGIAATISAAMRRK